MRRVWSDPLLWVSLFFVAVFPALDYYVLERNYYEAGVFFGFAVLAVLLMFVWFAWTTFCLVAAAYRWKDRRWLGAFPLAASLLVLPAKVFLSGAALWEHYNFHKFHESRLDYARRGDGNWGKCKTGTVAPGEPPSSFLSMNETRPEAFGTPSAPYVLYYAFVGIPDGFWGFLYAPSLDDPVKALPQLNLEFAVLWDEKACVFLVGNR